MNTIRYTGLRTDSSGQQQVEDHLTIEHPLSVSVNGNAFTLTMQTPGQEEDLVRGLLFTEGIYKKKDRDPEFQVTETSDQGFISAIDVVIDAADLDQSRLNKRNLLSVASCGICGKTELDIHEGRLQQVNGDAGTSEIHRMFREMEAMQGAYIRSGGCHAAAAFSSKGELLVMREDIGRHNAVDKVVGSLLRQRQISAARYLLVSGRVSYEIVTKAFTAGIPFILAVSAPSSLAVDFCKELGITLYGFCRDDRATRYA